jgi:hypothetical protein
MMLSVLDAERVTIEIAEGAAYGVAGRRWGGHLERCRNMRQNHECPAGG